MPALVVVDVTSRSTDPVSRLGGVPMHAAISSTHQVELSTSCFVDRMADARSDDKNVVVCVVGVRLPSIQRATNNGARALGPFFILVG